MKKKKNRSYTLKKGLLDPTDVVINPQFTKEVMEYPYSSKLKPPSIDPYDKTKDPVDHI